MTMIKRKSISKRKRTNNFSRALRLVPSALVPLLREALEGLALGEQLSFDQQKDHIKSALIYVGSGQRMEMFESISYLLTDRGYWFALGYSYNCSDWLDNYPHDHKRQWFNSPRLSREYLMSQQEREQLAGMDETITICRGMTIEEYLSGNFGLSWSLNQKIADYFATEYWRYRHHRDSPKMVHSLTIPKSSAIAFFNERKEEEIIYDCFA